MRVGKLEIFKILLFGLMFPLTLFIFNITIGKFGLQIGYWISSGFYWIIILSFSIYFIGFKELFELYRFKKSQLQLWGLLAYIPVIGTLFVSFIPSFPKLKQSLIALTIITGIINGTSEELFWRGLTLRTEIKNKNLVYLSSMIGFGLWHFTLAMINGLKIQGGIGALVGGAFFMGILWQFVAIKTNNIFHVTLAHILVNIFAFSTLILDNW
jgi:membrane protease YdiL (CAAX protease family)